MRTISNLEIFDDLKIKKDSFSKNLELGSFFLLIKPADKTYSNCAEKKLLEDTINKIIDAGLLNLEISWSNNENWLGFVSKIKLKYPHINLGSASLINKKSIDDSLKIGLKYSMMKFWDKDLFNYAKYKKHLLIPGINNLEELKQAISCDCKIIKIYPIKNKDKLIDPRKFSDLAFIASGGLSIKDLEIHKSLGYKAIVIGEKGFKEEKLDPNIYEFLRKINHCK